MARSRWGERPAAVAGWCLLLLLFWRPGHKRATGGLPSWGAGPAGGPVVHAGGQGHAAVSPALAAARLNGPRVTLTSRRHGLTGRPDRLIKGDGSIIVEEWEILPLAPAVAPGPDGLLLPADRRKSCGFWRQTPKSPPCPGRCLEAA